MSVTIRRLAERLGVVTAVLAAVVGGLPAAPPAAGLVGDVVAFRDPSGVHPVGFDSITAGGDGNVWFGICVDDTLGSVTPTGEMRFFSDPDANCPSNVTLGPDGNVWFLAFNQAGSERNVGYITPAGEITTFETLPDIRDVVAGPDGNVWLMGVGGLVKMDTAGNVLTSYGVGTVLEGNLAVGPDGNLWFRRTEGCPGTRLALVRATMAGTVTSFCDPTETARPTGWVAAGPGETVWFTSGLTVSSIDTDAADPAATMRVVADLPASSVADSMANGPDGNMWMTYDATTLFGRVSPDGTVSTFRTDVDELTNLGAVTVGPDGNLWLAAFGDAEDPLPGGIGQVALGAPACNAAPPAAPFIDVADSAWYGESVDWGACHGFVQGVAAQEFGPTRSMKRGQLAQTLWQMVDRPGATPGFASPEPHGYADVATTRWFNDALDWEFPHRLFASLPGGEFDSHREVRRGELAHVLWEMVGSPAASGPSGYVDVPAAAWYAPAVDWAAEHGLIVTGSDTMVHPKKTVTRAQALETLYRLASDPSAWADWDGGTVSSWRFDAG